MATKAEKQAYAKKLLEIERRLGKLERGTIQRSIALLKQLRGNIAGEITQLTDWDQYRILQTRENLEAMIANYEAQLRSLSNGAIRDSSSLGGLSVVEPLESAGLTNVFFRASPAQINTLVDFSADLIQDLGNKFRGQINREIQMAALGDKGIHKTMQSITKILYGSNRPPPFTPNMPGFKGKIGGVAYDAERILRTEVNRAYNMAANSQRDELAKQVPGLEQQWISTADNRTRIEHLKAHGQIVPVGKPFIIGGEELRFPGDPAASAENTINCRCTVITVIPEIGPIPSPLDDKVQAELDKRDADKKAKELAKPFTVSDERAMLQKLFGDNVDELSEIRPPPGRAPRGLGTEYAQRNRIANNIEKHIRWRSASRQHIMDDRGQTSNRRRITDAKERIRQLDKAIPAMLDIAKSGIDDWGFIDELVEAIATEVTTARGMVV